MSYFTPRYRPSCWVRTILLVAYLIPAPLIAQPTSEFTSHPEFRAPVLTRREITLTVPMPYLREQFPAPPPPGAYRWRLVPNHPELPALVIGTDRTQVITDLRSIPKRSAIYLCPPTPKDGLLPTFDECRRPIAGSVAISANVLIVVVSETSVVNAWRRHAPKSLWRYTFEPMGRYQVDELSIVNTTGDK